MSTPDPTEISASTTSSAEALFYEALDRPEGERADFLRRACGSDDALRAEVEASLHDYKASGSFLSENESPSPEFEAELARLQPEEVGERIGPYKLLEQIGEGGFGRVWVAEQERPIRRRVALKIIKLGMDTKQVVARFEQERQALALMDHPNIARVLDAGSTATGRPFFVMELVKGIKITQYCDDAHLSTQERLRLFIQVCNAVQHAHQKGIIHRDLKPSNILVTMNDGTPLPKVIDFGVAKATQQQRLTDLTVYTQFEQIIGTPLYMAPEQAEMSALDVDTRSDIYSLGVLLYELLTGRTPFDPERLMKAGFDEMRRVIREEEPQKPSTFVSTLALEVRTKVAKHRNSEGAKLISNIRGDLDWIVMKALEKDRNRRYETASGFAKDIERHLESEPVQARPPTAGYRLRRFVARHRLAAMASCSVFMVLVFGVIGIVWQALRAERERERANDQAARATAALSKLRASAPAFAVQARSLVSEEKFDAALEKLEMAMTLDSENPAFPLFRGDILQSQFRFAEAMPCYKEALRLNPAERRAANNAELCEKLTAEVAQTGKLSHNSLTRLLNRLKIENRSPAEMMHVSRLLGEETELIQAYWLDRLKDLPIPPNSPLKDRIRIHWGQPLLDLNSTPVSDLSVLQGAPLQHLILNNCERFTDLRPLSKVPLRSLQIARTRVTDLTPLSGMESLHKLIIDSCLVKEVSPLRSLKLTELSLTSTPITDLSPLNGMPLQELCIADTPVTDLSPLKGMPLTQLECTGTRAINFSPLAGLPLEILSMQATEVRDLSFLQGMPLKTLLLNGSLNASGFKVLQNIPTLEGLTLPESLPEWPDEEIAAISALRTHDRLKYIQMGGRTFGNTIAIAARGGPTRINIAPKESFWPFFDMLGTHRRAEGLARAGKFLEAEKLLRNAVEDVTIDDPWVGIGAVLFASGDRGRYQRFCEGLLERKRREDNPNSRTRPSAPTIVKICCLSPEPPLPESSLDELMTKYTPDAGRNTPWFDLAEGMRLLRRKQPEKVIEALRTVSTGEQIEQRMAASSAVLAMAYHAKGDARNLMLELARARDTVTRRWPQGRAVHAWHDWLVAYILWREAEQLVTSSVAHFREYLESSRARLGNDSAQVRSDTRGLAGLLEYRGELSEAELLRREVLQGLRQTAGANVEDLEGRIYELSENLYRQQKYSEAELLCRELLQMRMSRLRLDHDEVLYPKASLARLLADWVYADLHGMEIPSPPQKSGIRSARGRAEEAERLLKECLDARLAGTNPQGWRMHDVRSRLGAALLSVALTESVESKKRSDLFAEAEGLLLSSRDVMETQKQASAKYRRDAIIRLIRLYSAWGKSEQVDVWKHKLVEFDKSEHVPQNEKLAP